MIVPVTIHTLVLAVIIETFMIRLVTNVTVIVIMVLKITLRSFGGCTYWPKTEDTCCRHVGSRIEASKHRLRRHLGVSRHMPGEDSEDTWAFEDTFPAKTLFGAKTRGRPKTLPERTALAKTLPVVKPCSREKAVAEDTSSRAKARILPKTHGRAKTRPEDSCSWGEDPHRREDTWEGETRSGEDARSREDTCGRRHVPKTGRAGRRHASSRRHMGGRRHFPKTVRAKTASQRHMGGRRHFPKTGRANTLIFAKTHGRAKTLPEDRSGEDNASSRRRGRAKTRPEDRSGEHTHRREDTGATSCPRGVKEPGGVAGCGVKTRRHLPKRCRGPVWRRQMWRQMRRHLWHRWSCTRIHANGITWRHRTWRQNMASGAIDLAGVAGRGVNTWR